MNWDFIHTKNGLRTVVLKKQSGEFLLHSKYNPDLEAERWVAQWEIEKHSPKKLLVIGIGAGFHIEKLNQGFPFIPLTVWDFNPEYVKWLTNNGGLRNLVEKKIEFHVSDDWEEIKTKFIPLIDDTETLVLIHTPSLELIPEKLTSLKGILDEHVLFLRTVRRHGEQLESNFNRNLKLNDMGIKEWKDKLRNNKAILVSAGPSLTKQLPFLKAIHQKGGIFLGSVGTALIPLLNYGIKPDLVMVSDPQVNIQQQFVHTNTSGIPMFYLSTANHEAVADYKGKRFIVWQKGFEKSESQAALSGEPLIQTGGSVATCLLDLLVWMGSTEIALVGQDLAFSNGYSHAEGTHGFREIQVDHLIETTDYYQKGKVPTSKNLNSYLKWFERYRRSLKKNVELWNCTEGGAYIPGWIHRDLQQFVNEMFSIK